MPLLKKTFSLWETFIFFATVVVVTYVFGTAAVAYRYFWVPFFPDPERALLEDAGLGAGARGIEIATADGERLVAWYAPLPGRPLVIYLHGDIGNLSEALTRVRAIARQDFSLLALEYRGYGGSTGEPDEAGLYMDADAAWLKALELGYTPDRIALLGESYGAGVALNLASRRDVACVVVEGAYSAASDILADRFWGFPARLIMFDRVRSDTFVKSVRAPLLFVHGERDVIVPIKYARELFQAAREPKTFISTPDKGHLVLEDAATMEQVGDWLRAQFDARRLKSP